MTETTDVGLIKKRILEEIVQADTIIIHRHVNADPDAIGSQCGLAEIIMASFPEKKVKTAGDPVGNLSFLATMTPPSDEEYKDALVIVTDTANEARISGKKYAEGKKVIKIDHHPKDDAYGSIEWNDTTASSCSEMIVDFWQSFPETLKMTAQGARLLYAGIVGDTNRFLYKGTTPTTMRSAAALMEFEFSHTELNDQFHTGPLSVARLKGHVLQTMELDKDSGFVKIVITQEILQTYGLEDKDSSPVVNLAAQIEGALLWAVFVEQADGTYRCRLRSKGPEISEVARKHNGGGHPLASGANAKDVEELEMIVEELTELGLEWRKQTTAQV